MADERELKAIFDDAVEYLEGNESLKHDKLLSLEALQEIVLEKNLESLPFYSYVKAKYNGAYCHLKSGGNPRL